MEKLMDPKKIHEESIRKDEDSKYFLSLGMRSQRRERCSYTGQLYSPLNFTRERISSGVCGSGCDGMDGCVLKTGRTVNKEKEQKRMEERREQ